MIKTSANASKCLQVAFTMVLLCVFSVTAFAQRPSLNTFSQGFGEATPQKNTAAPKPRVRPAKRDSVVSVIPDSLRSKGNDLQTTVDYSARDSTVLDVDNETVYLYGDASVNYGDIELKADFIKLDWGASEVYAHGLPDTTKKVGEPVSGKPIFSQGNEAYNTDTIRYNFKSKRAIIKGIVTQQGDGIIQGKKVKKDSVDNLYLIDAIYTTCNLKDPHFHIVAKRIKLVNKKNVISGPFNLVIADIPLPIGLPFGFFPVPKDKDIGTSGFIMGQYGEEPRDRGFYFRDFGYYHAFNENIGIKVLGQIYSRGSWGVGLQSNYVKRYKYAGNLNLQFNSNKPGDVILAENKDNTTKDFNVGWSHSPQSRRTDRSFSASVNLRSNGFNRNQSNPLATQLYTASTSNSSIQVGRNFGSLLRTNAGISVDQNFSTKVFNLNTSYSIGLNQFNPFVKEENQTGRWFEQFRVGFDVQGGYQTTNNITGRTRSTTYTDYQVYGVSNIPLTDEELRLQALGQSSGITVASLTDAEGLKEIKENGQFRTTFSVPVSLPNFKLARYINVTPSVSYRGEVFTQKLNYEFFKKDTTFTRNGELIALTGIDTNYGAVRIDTSNGFYTAYNVSAGIGMNTRVYGKYNFGGKGRLQAIRHTVAPSINLNFTPDLTNKFFVNTQVRSDDTTKKWLPMYSQLGSTPGASGQISFSLTNQLEAKLRAKSDTAEKQFEKISLLDNFGFSGGYNMLADSMNLSNLSFSANTRILKDLINLNASATLDPYAYREDVGSAFNLAGRRVKTFKWNTPGFSGAYFSSYQVSLSTRLTPQTFNKDKGKKPPTSSIKEDPAAEAMRKFVAANPLAYVDFSIPWSMNVSFNYSRSQQGLAAAQTVAALQLTGDFSLTQKWKFNFSTGYDFNYKAQTLTTLGVIRDLHCWDMSFNWTPIAGNNLRASNYSFTLNVRSALLKDLKVSRRRIYYDVGGF